MPIKQTDTRAKRFIEQHGPTAYELDALHPLQLQDLVRKSIKQFTDMDAIAENKEQEEVENERLDILREETLEFMGMAAQELGV